MSEFERDDRNKRKSGNRKIMTAAFIGAVIGALIIFLGMSLFDEETDQQATDKTAATNASAEEGNNGTPSVTGAVEQSMDSVVSVFNYRGGDIWEGSERTQAGSGSGVIYKKENDKAYVVTNHHVIAGASQIEISLSNQEKIPAELMGSDPLLDLAVLEVDAEKIDSFIKMGKSDDLKPGETVIAIGNPLGFLQGTVTTGVVSAAERTMPVDVDENGSVDWESEVIQTDASINPGNSGGALIDLQGELIGINSSKIALEAVEGIGFAIPVDIAKPILQDLEEHGEVRRPQIGIFPISLSEIPSQYYEQTLNLPGNVKSGVVIREVEPSSPAGQAGLRQFDVITRLDDQDINNASQLRKYLYTEKEIGDEVEVTYYRGGEKRTTTLQL
ncbi:S1C family serine protease [Bacillus sp. V59.32b]|uniref:S1C family serine protease n=1 Tax=Bacillus sp. V59.32b TaxID=1758642 RepID=UPI000E3CCB5D|nr:trypsin-like peptidase domain-containing protein [Bacillus sp. V59.32b]RFU64220.1 PDZ domain-containing protein [Bacillus sp. V59.32b]